MFSFSLKSLKWTDLKGGKEQAISPEYLYRIEPDGKDKYRVGYLERASDEPIQYATGFASVKAAKNWVQHTHHPEKMAAWLHDDTGIINRTLSWFGVAKPKPTFNDYTTQLGCHYEEVSEMIEAQNGCRTIQSNMMSCLGDELKDQYVNDPRPIHETLADDPQQTNDLEELDALCDQIVTALGTGYMKGYDMIGAMIEVNRSNWSKFENGKPVLKDNGKIAKGKYFTEPDLRPYLGLNYNEAKHGYEVDG